MAFVVWMIPPERYSILRLELEKERCHHKPRDATSKIGLMIHVCFVLDDYIGY